MIKLDNADIPSSGIVVVKFGAVWCGPCKKMEPILEKLEGEFPDITFLSVDVDELPELAKQYKVKAVPTTILLKDGQEANKVVGLSLIDPLRKIFRDVLKDSDIDKSEPSK